MKKFLAIAIAVGAVWLYAQRNDNRRTDSLLPQGAIFYLEAKDFHRVLTEWNGSEEKRRWLKSDSASVLSQSRLLQRLIQAQTHFATVAGLPVEMNMVNELAGGQSAFAFYDFSSLRFVYVTHIDGSRLDQSGLWKSRSSYQTREAAGIPFYLKTQTEGRDIYTVAFASHDGWLVVATDTDLMAHTLALLAGQAKESVASETWYADTVKQIPEQGDLRLVYDLNKLRNSPHFRTYWIQRNNSELSAFTAGSADLFEQANGFEERRVLLRAAGTDAKVDSSGLTRVLSHIPAGASLYRAWEEPSRDLVKSVLTQVVLSETAQAAVDKSEAPEVSTEAPVVGSDSDLETRIDQSAFHRESANNIDAVTDAVMAMEPRALLHSQLTQLTGDRVFVVPDSEMALACAKPDQTALNKALETSVSLVKTGSLDPLKISDENGVLVLSRLGGHAAAAKGPAVLKGESYLANYEHSSEWPRYKRLFSVIDPKTEQAPAFFSSNLRSLGDSLYRLRSVSMTTQDEGGVTRDTVRYEFLGK